MIKIFLFLSLVGSLGLPLSALAADSADQATIRQQLNALFEASKKVNTPPNEKEKSRKEIDGAIDWDGIAQLCLGEKNTKKYQGKNFGDFKELLREVISKTAFSRMDKFWAGGTKAQIDTVEITGNKAHVAAKFLSNEETFALDYYLNKKGSRWLINDVAYEDMKYSVNIKEQLDAFLKEKPFSDLLNKLRKKSEELDKPVKVKNS